MGANAQQNQADQGLSGQAGDLLGLHIEVANQNYCHIDDESFSVTMDVKMRFTNVSDHPVILSRKIEDPSNVHVARDVEAAQRKEFLYDPNYDYFVSDLPDAPAFGKAPNAKLFVVLPAGGNYETVTQTQVFGSRDAAHETGRDGLLAKGSYLLQIGVTTWPYEWPHFNDKTDTKKLRQRWAGYGDLATGFVYSDFAPFTVPDHLKNPRCR